MSTKIKKMIDWAKDLFPICRSITGEGARTTLKYFEKINPELKRLKFKSGTKVFDWKIPKEWNIRNAYIEHESGKKFANFKNNNLHVVGYSKPINVRITKKELIKKIHSIKNQPDAIPYVTSYYNEDWGFCMSENEKKKLPDGKYKVFIDSKFKKGFLDISHALIKGKSKKEIFFSTYICHPSMANDNISSVAVQAFLIKYLKENFKKTKYSYRFVFLPETIGSISYISKRIKTLKKNVIFGFTLSCLGDDKNYSIINSPHGNYLSDYALESALINLKKVKKYSFLERGSDERQYCSPRVNLPITGFAKSKYHTFKQYHTSLDNLNFISPKGLFESFNVLKNIINASENSDIFPISNFVCEPNLGKRSLLSTISKRNDEKNKTLKNFIAYCDGNRSIFEISIILNKNLQEIVGVCEKLFLKKLIRYKKI